MTERLRTHRRTLLLCLGAAAVAAAACTSSSSDAPPTNLDFDAGSLDGASPSERDGSGNSQPDGGQSPDGTTPDGTAPDGATEVDAGPRDPFQAQWRMPVDVPSSSDYVAADGGIITDKRTGLRWFERPLDATMLPPDGGDGFVGTQADGRSQCESATIGGETGWRLPTRIEWLSVAALDDHYVLDSPFSKSDYEGVPYIVAMSDTSRIVSFEGHYHPHTFQSGFSGGGGAVACVKSPYPVAATAQDAPAGRFVAAPSMVTDTVTHLVWARAYNPNPIFYTQAQDYCANLAAAGSDAGVNDDAQHPWRVPTVKEWATLWNEKAGLPPELSTGNVTQYYWTSTEYITPVIGGGGTFRFYFTTQYHADGDIYWDTSYNVGPARCVRDLD